MSIKTHARVTRRLGQLLRTKGQVGAALRPLLTGSLKHAGRWGWSENIVGVALGWKGSAKAPCLTFFVRRKLSAGRLDKRQFIPEGLRVASQGVELLTKIVEVGAPAQLHAPFAGTLRSGQLLGHEHGVLAPGSAGALLESTVPGDRGTYLLSSAHVVALAIRDAPLAAAGQFVEQPFKPGSDPDDARVARLTPHFSSLTSRKVQTDDFAIARLEPGVQWNAQLKGTTRIARTLSTRGNADDFFEGEAMTHYGARTGPSTGSVTQVEGSFTIASRGAASSSEWTYQGLIPYDAVAVPGDSGAAVMRTGTSELVGIHIGGFDSVQVAFFFPIGPTLAALNFQPVANRSSPAE